MNLKRLQRDKLLPLREAKKTALHVFNSVSESFEESTGQSFTNCLTLNPKTRLQVRLSKQDQKQRRHEQIRNFALSIENKLKESAVSALLGTRTSKSQFNKLRMIDGFEQEDDKKEQLKDASTKSHIPSVENIEIGNHDEETLIAEVQLHIHKVNSDRKLQNGGQVLKEFLRSKNVDVDRFGKPSIPRTRRKRKRVPGGGIS